MLTLIFLTLAAPQGCDLSGQMPSWLAEAEVPSAAVAVIRNGRLSCSAVFGQARPSVPADKKTLYNVASLAKPVVAETVLRLVAKGKLDLDEPLSAYWVDPDVAEDPRHQALTPRIMLSHRSGFPNWRQGKLEFRSDPGKASGYSGEGFEYLARFLERKFRRSIDALVTEEVFRPLSMAHTHMVADPATREKLAYARDAEGQTRPADARDTASAADDLLTRADDYGRFVAAVMRGDGLNAPLARERFHVTVPQMEGRCPWNVECPKSVGFALGWAVFDYGDERVMVQGGGDWGERALAIFVPERDLAVVVLTNGFGGGAVIRRVVETLYDNPRFHRFLAFQSKG